MKNPLTARRDKLDLTQEAMAAILKTVQSEISKSEAGEMPPESALRKWAKAYRCTVKRFRIECQAASWEPLPLWKYAVTTPQEIEHIECKPRPDTTDLPALISGLTREAQQILIQQYEARKQA